jgi:hypothetical protein
MGASESKLVFKQGIFRLSEEQEIPADDPYWTRVWIDAKGQAVYVEDLKANYARSSGSSLNQPKMSLVSLRRLTSGARAIIPCPIFEPLYLQSPRDWLY